MIPTVLISVQFHNSINFNTAVKYYTSSLTNETSKDSNIMNTNTIITINRT